MIKFIVYGEPVAQDRLRASAFHGKVQMYDLQKSRNFKKDVKHVAP